jgi:hypothetical protein
VLRGYIVSADRVTEDKYLRAQPVAAAAENGYLRVVRGQHTAALLDELVSFPHGRHDDCVDALSGAHRRLSRPRDHSRASVPRGRIPGVGARPDRLPHRVSGRGDPVEQIGIQLGAHIYDTRNR